MIEDLLHIPVIGVIPWMDVDIEDEDSVTERFNRRSGNGALKAAVVHLPHISNFTDFNILGTDEGLSLRYAASCADLKDVDIILLPGTKNTIEDLNWLKQKGLADEIIRFARAGGTVIGICGGYQMLGERLYDPEYSESRIPEIAGLGLLDMSVTFHAEKTTVQSTGTIQCSSGWLQEYNGTLLDGYEIHSGTNRFGAECVPFLTINGETDGVTNPAGNVIGTYLHGIFDNGIFWRAAANHVRESLGIAPEEGQTMTMAEFRDREYDRLAEIVRGSLDMDSVYRIIRGEDVPCGRWDGE